MSAKADRVLNLIRSHVLRGDNFAILEDLLEIREELDVMIEGIYKDIEREAGDA